MPLAPGSTVSPHVALAPVPQPQPPLFGVVEAVGGAPSFSAIVLWNDGRIESSILSAYLDEIVAADPSAVSALTDKIVRPVAGSGTISTPSFDAEVVMVFKRAPGGGTPGKDHVLTRTLSTGTWFEREAAAVKSVVGK